MALPTLHHRADEFGEEVRRRRLRHDAAAGKDETNLGVERRNAHVRCQSRGDPTTDRRACDMRCDASMAVGGMEEEKKAGRDWTNRTEAAMDERTMGTDERT